ncbi:MAG: zinc metallopeptidase [Schaedlerella sp.]|nr:zinc metallopeptidase [Schaedlerella sp.]
MTYYYLTFGLLILSFYISSMVQSRFNKYSKYRAFSGMTGAQAAERILRANGIYDVQIRQTRGSLTDNYNPMNKTLNLSETVYGRSSVSSIAVAAHECGHAIQHATAYGPLSIRKKLVPIANVSSNFSYILVFAGILLQMSDLVMFGAILFSAIVLFNLVTLPVEIDASKRALTQVERLGILTPDEMSGGKKVLTAAGMTYFVALLSAMVQLLRLLSIANRGRRK